MEEQLPAWNWNEPLGSYCLADDEDDDDDGGEGGGSGGGDEDGGGDDDDIVTCVDPVGLRRSWWTQNRKTKDTI